MIILDILLYGVISSNNNLLPPSRPGGGSPTWDFSRLWIRCLRAREIRPQIHLAVHPRHRVEISRHHRVDSLLAVSDGFLMRAIPGGGLFGRGAFAPIVGIVFAESRVVVATRDQVDRAFRRPRARRDPVRGASRVVGSALPGVHRPNAGIVRRVRGVSANQDRSLPKTRIEIGEFAPHHTSLKKCFARSGRRTCCGARHRLPCRVGRFGHTAMGGVPDSGEQMPKQRATRPCRRVRAACSATA